MKNQLIKFTFILSLTGILTRIMGFYYRIFLSKTIGAESLGLYQMIFPIYGLCYSFSVSGIQLAISRFTAVKYGKQDREGMFLVLKTGLFISVALTLASMFILNGFSGVISKYVLHDERCATLLKTFSFCLIFSCIHSCVNAFYLGHKKVYVPAFTQLSEQGIRIASVVIIATVLQSSGIDVSAEIAVVGSIIGEASSAFLSLCILFCEKDFKFFKFSKNKVLVNDICTLAYPISLNRIISSLFASLEAALVPMLLKKYGLSAKEALSVYGILCGMVIPLIMFPSTITGALSNILMPSVAINQAAGNIKNVYISSIKVMKCCVGIGFLCTAFFLIFGDKLSTLLFSCPESGTYISILAWLCPFMYLCSTVCSILNGLGYTTATFRHNIISTCIQLGIIYFFVPTVGIKAYLFAILICYIVCTILHIRAFFKLMS